MSSPMGIGRAFKRAVAICGTVLDVVVLLVGMGSSGGSVRRAVEMMLAGERASHRMVNLSSTLDRRFP